MNRENEKLNNVRRLAYCLYERVDDTRFINRPAMILNYMPEQLQQDISDLELYTADKVRSDRELIDD